jgi:hypothetical protein
LPTIHQRLLDSVVFLYDSEDDAKNGVKTGGSGFLVGVYSSPRNTFHLYVVTNHHVAAAGCSVVRMTSRSRDAVIVRVPQDQWIYPAGNDDPAIWRFKSQIPTYDEEFSYLYADEGGFVQEVRQFPNGCEYGPGAECFMLGRFVTHDGRQRNLPTARFGNISMGPREKIQRRPGIDVDAFLVETRSQAGYSGSPVFVYKTETTPLRCQCWATVSPTGPASGRSSLGRKRRRASVFSAWTSLICRTA